jgi:hypothetical protein
VIKVVDYEMKISYSKLEWIVITFLKIDNKIKDKLDSLK